MILEFGFDWIKNSSPLSKIFKLEGTRSLFEDYSARIQHYAEIKFGPLCSPSKETAAQLWICHTGSSAKMLSSEDLSKKLETVRDSGIRKLVIGIGGPDGFTKDKIADLKPTLIWNFGPMTLPHELAAVVAAEQLYRAWTILHHLPYHKGHL